MTSFGLVNSHSIFLPPVDFEFERSLPKANIYSINLFFYFHKHFMFRKTYLSVFYLILQTLNCYLILPEKRVKITEMPVK